MCQRGLATAFGVPEYYEMDQRACTGTAITQNHFSLYPMNDVLEFDKARSFALKRLIKAGAVDRDFWKARSLT